MFKNKAEEITQKEKNWSEIENGLESRRQILNQEFPYFNKIEKILERENREESFV